MASTITNPVGKLGLNRSQDVGVIQRLLNAALDSYTDFKATGLTKLTEDNSIGPLTIGAIEIFQSKVLKWSGPAVDGTVTPGRATWKALNGNVSNMSEIKPQPTTRATWQGNYAAFRQGDYKDKLGDSTSASIAGYGCALCTLTMAATYIGSRTKFWPDKLTPKELTPPKANEICRKAGVFTGFALYMQGAANALGMDYDEHGRTSKLGEDDIDHIDAHLSFGKPVAANVDYKSGSAGDHWILVNSRAGDATYTAIDPAYGTVMKLASNRNQTVNNARYASTKNEKTGVLFGWKGSGGSKNQEQYIVVRFALLAFA